MANDSNMPRISGRRVLVAVLEPGEDGNTVLYMPEGMPPKFGLRILSQAKDDLLMVCAHDAETKPVAEPSRLVVPLTGIPGALR